MRITYFLKLTFDAKLIFLEKEGNWADSIDINFQSNSESIKSFPDETTNILIDLDTQTSEPIAINSKMSAPESFNTTKTPPSTPQNFNFITTTNSLDSEELVSVSVKMLEANSPLKEKKNKIQTSQNLPISKDNRIGIGFDESSNQSELQESIISSDIMKISGSLNDRKIISINKDDKLVSSNDQSKKSTISVPKKNSLMSSSEDLDIKQKNSSPKRVVQKVAPNLLQSKLTSPKRRVPPTSTKKSVDGVGKLKEQNNEQVKT